jgi:gamma-glutamyl:cysteine ligase YbdK (ATP-grasp superfamily)
VPLLTLVRYDFKTATKLLEAMRHLVDQYHGNLNTLHDDAKDARDLENRLKALGKGIGVESCCCAKVRFHSWSR